MIKMWNVNNDDGWKTDDRSKVMAIVHMTQQNIDSKGSVISEKMIKLWKVYRQKDDGCRVVLKAYLAELIIQNIQKIKSSLI